MKPANGHAHENGGAPAMLEIPPIHPHSAERVAELVAALEVPFDPAQIDAELLSVRGKYNKQSAKAEIDPSSVGEPRDGSEGRGEWEV